MITTLLQTFRPYFDHRRSAAALDNRRLGKQRVEAKQIFLAVLRRLGALDDGRRGWLNHPIVLKWFNGGHPYLLDLKNYFDAVVDEWVRRGHINNISLDAARFLHLGTPDPSPLTHVEEVEYRRILLYKDPDWYTRRFARDEVEEVLYTEPAYINGVNGSIFKNIQNYRAAERKIKRILAGEKKP